MTNSQAWDFAIGMVGVDGLQPTDEFMEHMKEICESYGLNTIIH